MTEMKYYKIGIAFLVLPFLGVYYLSAQSNSENVPELKNQLDRFIREIEAQSENDPYDEYGMQQNYLNAASEILTSASENKNLPQSVRNIAKAYLDFERDFLRQCVAYLIEINHLNSQNKALQSPLCVR